MEGELRLIKNGLPEEGGVPAEIATEQGVNSVFAYSIPPRSLRIITGRGESGEIITGHADIVPASGSSTPASFAVLTLSENNGLLKTTVEAQEPA